MQSPLLRFTSDTFPIIAGEDDEVNPGIYGKALSEWLAVKLVEKDFKVVGVFAEDFGRLIEIETKVFNLSVICANEGGAKNQWCIFVICEGSLFKSFFSSKIRNQKAQIMNDVFVTIQSILQAEDKIKQLEISAR